MDHARLHALGDRFRARRDGNRDRREKSERQQGLQLLAFGLFAGIVTAAAIFFVFN